ncbi:helix-turn-helix transcriptional regulator [Proteiniclasticum sp. SCR006]|uniref:Helix-turn-helix transcriptional regulator n=1 Tax=Proteiniclasticum aestuarii TaxID=2817862 RepID=A0A939KFG8_9CLOT|nr:helix-turn-helix transcriptional regulator [Proteiniclasticum aestuarii]MBO1264447.1 helix-turn-helix transcriptional regulator [Proteiniclasticum aestuarii]
MTPGMKIKIARIQRHKKQYQFARELGISREYLRLIESDKAKNPSTDLMKKIAEQLETKVGALFFDEEV